MENCVCFQLYLNWETSKHCHVFYEVETKSTSEESVTLTEYFSFQNL